MKLILIGFQLTIPGPGRSNEWGKIQPYHLALCQCLIHKSLPKSGQEREPLRKLKFNILWP